MIWHYDDLQKWINNGCDLNIAKKVLELNCINNDLEKLPKEIGKLINLEKLDCSKNTLETLPKEIWKLINLKKLNFSDNRLKKYQKKLET